MNLSAYTITCSDDTDVLWNTVRSVAETGAEHWLLDVGQPFFCQHPVDGIPIADFVKLARRRIPKARLRHVEVEWSEANGGHAALRNLGLAFTCLDDWTIQIDSDEVLTDGLIEWIANDLPKLPDEIVAVAPKLLTLVPDERHYSTIYSQTMSHGRIVRPTKVKWQGAWHEHQEQKGMRLNIDRYLIHTRQLFTNRCIRQRGHGWEAWQGIRESIRPVDELRQHWLKLDYPPEDRNAD